jgi:exosortase
VASVLDRPADGVDMTMARRVALFAACCAGVLLVHAPVAAALYAYSSQHETASHLILIPGVSAFLLIQGRDAIFRAVASAPRPGLAVIAAGVAVSVAAWLFRTSLSAETALILAVSGPVVQWLGVFLLFFGPAAFRAGLFPLLFLLFTIPIPTPVIDAFVHVLRTGSTEAVASFFVLTGTPYFREGYVFALPGVSIEVAEECSGIRSSLALMLTSLLAGHMWLDRPWKRAILVAVALPLTIVKNGIRIVSLSLLSIHVNPEFLTGQLHHDGGVVFFLLTLVMLAPIVALLRSSRVAPPRPA